MALSETSTLPTYLPYARQTLDEADIAAVTAVLQSDWLTTGPTIAAFEADFAAATGARHAVACSSGTAALHLSMMALDLQPGDWIVVPTATFLATANVARYMGADVSFADVDPDTGLMTPESLVAAIERAGGPVKAILPVHLAGQVVDLDAMAAIVDDIDAVIVEDACHALGGKDVANHSIGDCRIGKMATFSLHPAKTITAGEGGVTTTNDDAAANSMRLLRNHGMVRAGFAQPSLAIAADGGANPWYYEMPTPGYNYRLTDIAAALAQSQLRKLPAFIERRAELVQRYDHRVSALAPVIRPTERMPGAPGWHLYVVLIDFVALGLDRAALMARLREAGIGTQVHYVPVHHQPYYRQRYGALTLPGADAWYERALSLPLFPAMTDGDVDRVVDVFAEICKSAGISG